MRCRSEPFRMASSANRFWDSPAQKEYQSMDRDADEDDEEEEGDEEDLDEEQPAVEESRQKQAETFEEATEDDLGGLLQHREVVEPEQVESPEAALQGKVQEQKVYKEIVEIGSSAVIFRRARKHSYTNRIADAERRWSGKLISLFIQPSRGCRRLRLLS